MHPRMCRMARFAARIGLVVILSLTAIASGGVSRSHAQPPKRDGQPPKKEGDRPQAKPGVSINTEGAYKGYTLVAALNSTKAHLIDMDGHVVKTWETGVTPGASTYFLDNGNLLRTGNLKEKSKINGAASGGHIQEFDWKGDVVWDFTYSSDRSQQHHDIHKMPNGNVLMIVWDKKTADEAVAAGRRPDSVKGSLLADAIIEVKPTGKTSGEIVWEWHAWDHLVQDHDKSKANYGSVAAKSELIDVNFGSGSTAAMVAKKDDLKKLRDLGYIGGGPQPTVKGPDGKGPNGKGPDAKGPDGKGPNGKGPDGKGPGGGFGFTPDWTHFNAIAYNADLDQIVVSVHSFSEIWILDHSTTTAEAAGHTGGRYGKGGDLIFRWGNPRAYRSGTNADQRLFNQHNAHWIPKGLPGEGHLIVFNNGGRRPDGSYSSVDELVLPAGPDGKYSRKPGLPFGPDKPIWSYTAPKKTDFFATFISGANRLPNGNTLICSGPDGTVFEVTPDKKTVWKFVNPTRGGPGGPGMGGPGFGGPGFFVPPAPGQILPSFLQDQLKLTAEQKKQLDELQKEVDQKLEKIMTEDQRKEFKAMRDRGPGFGPPGGPGGPPGAGRGGPPGPGGLFRSYRIGVDHPGLVGKDLKPGPRIEELELKK